jgi:hypothetical protein
MKKKLFALAAAATMLSASAVAPTQANAALGLITGNAPLFIVGAVLTVLDSSVFVSCAGNPHFEHCHQTTVVGTAGLIGLVLLDGQGNQSVPFTALTTADGARLGVADQAQLDAYNHELDEINAVRSDILSDVLIQTSDGQQVKGSDVHAAWIKAKDQGLISPAAFAVIEKISAQAVSALDQAN